MSATNSSTLLLSRSIDGIEVIAIYANGRVVLRHLRPDGVLVVHLQDLPVVAEIIADTATLNWQASIIELPPTIAGHFEPSSVLGLRRASSDQFWDFCFTRVPCSPDHVEAICGALTRFAFLINSNEVTCHRDRYEAYLHRKSKDQSGDQTQ